MNKIKNIVTVLALFVGLLWGTAAPANSDLDAVFQRDTPPAGVVFEIVDWEQDFLAEAIPWVNQQIVDLREKFPDLEIAVVSHGREQFALLNNTEEAFPDIHAGVKRLISEHDVTLELCLGHATMQGYEQSDFPDYVEIEARGPAQIEAYEARGYDKVVVSGQ